MQSCSVFTAVIETWVMLRFCSRSCVCLRTFFFFFLCFTVSLWRKMLWCSPPKSQLHIAQCVWRCASFICWLVDECARSETRLTVKFTRVGEAQKKNVKENKNKTGGCSGHGIIFNTQLFSSLNVRASLSPWLTNTTGTHWLYHILWHCPPVHPSSRDYWWQNLYT